MANWMRKLWRPFCRHGKKRVWDIGRTAEGKYRVRLYCPTCGERWDVLREPDEVVHDAAKDNEELRRTMRRNMGLDDDES